MKRFFLRGFVFILVISLAAGFLPVESLAAVSELVLTKIGHTSADTVTISDAATRSVTLTVPFLYAGNSVDLSTGLIVDKASSINTVVTSFDSGSAAGVGDASGVVMTVTYFKTGDATQYTTDYTIKIARAAKVNPTFAGAVTKSVTGLMPNAGTADISFTAAEFTNLYTAHDASAISGISIEGSNLACGVLNYSGALYTSGDYIALTDISLLTFDALSGGSVTYIVRAYAGADHTTPIGSVLLNITVIETSVPSITGTGNIAKTVNVDADLTFSVSDFGSLYNLNHGALDKIEITPTNAAFGVWYNGAATFTVPTAFTAATIGSLKFTGRATGAATFTWRVSNEAGFSAPGSGTITVRPVSVPTITAQVTKTVTSGSALNFSLSDFSSCYNLNNGTLANIVITPSNNSYGTWYKGSVAFGSATSFNASDIATLSFSGTNAGQATFTWTVSNEKGASAAGSGFVTVTATASPVTYTTAQNTPKALVTADFNTVCVNTTGYALTGIYITSPSSGGTLYYNYTSASSPGTAITSSTFFSAASQPYLSYLTFVPVSGYTGTVTISYTGVTAYNTTYSGSLMITVGTNGDITYTTAQNTPKTLVVTDFNTACVNTTGYALSGIYISSPSSGGTLYYNYTSASSPGTAITSSTFFSAASQPYLSYLTYVPASGYTGTVTIPFTGINAYNTTYAGSLKITVGTNSDVTYTTAQNTPKTLVVTDFNTACVNATGYALSGIYISSPSSGGTLYYNYASASSPGTAITSSTLFNASSQPYLSYLTFVPASGYTGTVTIPYTGINVYNTTYAGSLKITVGTGGDVTYTTALNTPKTLVVTDFNTACVNATGYALSGIYISSPSSGGTLYYNYASASSPGTAITSSTLFNASSQPYLSYLTFVPASNYTGTVTIPYTGINAYSTTYAGSLTITVGSGVKVTYTVTKNTPKALAVTDFNAACVSATGYALSGIYITSPSSVSGTLYYNYSSASNPGTPITSTTLFNAGSAPYLSGLTFVPASTYTGTVTIPYTGVNTNGASFSGSLVLTVTSTVSDISYTTSKNAAVKFSAASFAAVSSSATGVNLNYITLTLPSASYGTLYYNYSATTHTGTAVAAGTAFYSGNTPSIDSITFVPAVNYTGTVTIVYTGSTVDSRTYSGKISVVVSPKTGSRYFTDVGASYDWAASAIDYLYEAGIAKGTGSALYSPGINISRGDFILMLSRAIGFSGSTGSNFSDVPQNTYYYDAIAAAKALGIAQGNDNKFSPKAPLTRQDAMVLIYRTLIATNKSVQAGSSADIAGFSDKGQIASYATTAAQALVKAGIITGSNGKINPGGALTRAEMAAIIYRVDVKW